MIFETDQCFEFCGIYDEKKNNKNKVIAEQNKIISFFFFSIYHDLDLSSDFYARVKLTQTFERMTNECAWHFIAHKFDSYYIHTARTFFSTVNISCSFYAPTT